MTCAGCAAQLVERLDGRARGLDGEPEAAEQLGELAERLDLRVCHQGAEPAGHDRALYPWQTRAQWVDSARDA